MIVDDIDPARDPAGWREWRRHGLGASDMAGVLGISPYASPWSVWADKVGLLSDDGRAPTVEMEAGLWLERAIRPWFSDRTGLDVHGPQTAHVAPGVDWARCTVDGLIESDGVLEIKTERQGPDWVDIPAHHQAQGQWQLAVTGRRTVMFAVLHGRRLQIYALDRDDADIGLMTERGEQFWTEHVVPGEPPPVDGTDATLDALAAVFGDVVTDQSVEIDPTLITRWVIARQQRIGAQATEAAAAAALQQQLEYAEIGTVDGRAVITWRPQTTTRTCKACGHRETSKPFRVLRQKGGKRG